jgi:hypothetical protein
MDLLNDNSTFINHANEYIEMHFTTDPEFGEYAECRISIGCMELITDCFMRLTLPKLDDRIKWKANVGKLIIKKVIFKINNIIFEEFDFDLVNIINGLTLSDDKKRLYDKMISSDTLSIPLKFFFNKYKINDLPIVAIHNVCVIGVDIANIKDLID